MAKSTVEILGGQLDGAILENAASEATLKELVAAISGNRGGSSGGSGARTPAGMIAGGVVGAVTHSVKFAVNQIGNATGAMSTFAGMMVKGEGRISSYTKVLNNQVISQIPLFGRYLGAVGGAISGTIEEFERWNKTLQGLTGTGATFNNSIIQMMNASANTYMSLDQFAAFVNKNSRTFVALGNTVTQGAEAFSGYSEAVLKASGPARKTLIQMGYTIPQINQQLADFLENNYRGTTQDRVDKTKLADSFVDYQIYVHKLTSLTGKRADQLQEEMKAVQDDTAFKLRLSTLEEDEKIKVNKALANYTALYGKEAANVFKARFLGLQPASEAAAELNMMFPQLISSMDNTLRNAQNKSVTAEQFNAYSLKERAKMIKHGAKQLGEFAPLLRAGAIGVEEVAGLTGVSADIANFIARQGVDVSKLTQEEIEEMLKKQDAEVKNREELTKILRSFEVAMAEFKKGFLDVVTAPGGMLDNFAKMMEKQELPKKIESMGKSMGQWVDKWIPTATRFFVRMTTPEGRQYYLLRIEKMLDTIAIHLMAFIPKMFGLDGMSPEDVKSQVQNLDKSYDSKLQEADANASASTAGITAPLSNAAGNVETNTAEERKTALAGGGVIMNDHLARAEVRNRPLSSRLNKILATAAKSAGVNLRIESGGQMSMADYDGAVGGPGNRRKDSDGNYLLPNGKKVRLGSERHDKGNAADFDVIDPASGKRIPYSDPRVLNLLTSLNKNGITGLGMGTGYMSGGNRIHAGLGKKGSWATDKGSDAEKLKAKQNDPAFAVAKQAGFRYGTLGAAGSLYANLGEGTDTEVHGEEAVLSPSELTAEMMGAAETSSAGVSQLNSNLRMLVGLMNRRNSLAEDIQMKLASKSNNLFTSVL